jgi:hypothetical protein
LRFFIEKTKVKPRKNLQSQFYHKTGKGLFDSFIDKKQTKQQKTPSFAFVFNVFPKSTFRAFGEKRTKQTGNKKTSIILGSQKTVCTKKCSSTPPVHIGTWDKCFIFFIRGKSKNLV